MAEIYVRKTMADLGGGGMGTRTNLVLQKVIQMRASRGVRMDSMFHGQPLISF